MMGKYNRAARILATKLQSKDEILMESFLAMEKYRRSANTAYDFNMVVSKDEEERMFNHLTKIKMENKNGAYDLEGIIYHQHSNKVMKAILEMWPDKTIPIVDLGCGHNFYTNVLKYAGYFAKGIDNTPLNGVDYIEDITIPGLNQKISFICSGNVISLEVGEHLPPHLSDPYLDNLTSFGGDIIMSWAVPGQAGVGHINCQWNAWVIEQMEKRNYKCDFNKTTQLRVAVQGCHCDWFQNTLMYFYPSQP